MYRYEKSGVVGGLSRVRAMTLNDAHIFCRPDQIKSEIAGVMRLVERAYATLGIKDYVVPALAARPGRHREVRPGRRDVERRRA